MAKKPGIRLLADVQSRFPEIKKVTDAKRTLKITFAIDTKDCELGKPQSPCTCPTALAVARHTGLVAMVRRWVTVLVDPKKRIATRYMNDPSLAKAIGSFDKTSRDTGRARFQPGIYTIRRPGPRQSLNRRPPAPTVRHGSHKHKGPQDPLRQTWAEPSPKFRPVFSRA